MTTDQALKRANLRVNKNQVNEFADQTYYYFTVDGDNHFIAAVNKVTGAVEKYNLGQLLIDYFFNGTEEKAKYDRLANAFRLAKPM